MKKLSLDGTVQQILGLSDSEMKRIEGVVSRIKSDEELFFTIDYTKSRKFRVYEIAAEITIKSIGSGLYR